MLSIQNQAALTEAGFAPTATPDFRPTGKFIAEYDYHGFTRHVEVGPAEDLDGYVEVRHFINGGLAGRQVCSLEQEVIVFAGSTRAVLTAN